MNNLPRLVFLNTKILFMVLFAFQLTSYFCNSLGAVKVVRNLQIGNVLSVLRTGGGWVNLG